VSAKGLTTGEISAHLAEVYGTSVSKDTISAITDRVIAELTCIRRNARHRSPKDRH
jgi:transposase-like protein